MLRAQHITVAIVLISAQAFSAQSSSTCEKGQQFHEGVCLSQRMVEYLVCVQTTGANKHKMSDIVQQVTKAKKDGEVSGQGSGVLVRGQGSVKGITASENSILRSLETTFFPGATSQCAAVLNSLPAESPKEEKPPKLNPKLRKSSSLQFDNEGGPIFNPDIKTATWMQAKINSGPECPTESRATTKILWSPATFGMNPQSDIAVFSYELGQAHEWAQTIADTLSKIAGVPRKCTSASFETFIQLTFDDSHGSSFVRNYRIASTSENPPSTNAVTPSVARLFDEANQALETAKSQNKAVSLPLALDSLLAAFK